MENIVYAQEPPVNYGRDYKEFMNTDWIQIEV